MDNYKQLYEKTNEEYKEFYPLTDILSIIDKESGKNLKQLLNQYNHIKLDWKGNAVDTRNSVPLILRHKGLFITYDNGTSIITEFYKGEDISTSINSIWQNDNNWTDLSPGASLADNEDIAEIDGKFKFADRNYNAAQFTGMGRIILRKNLVDVGGGQVKNVLTQDMINKSNTIYEIRYDFDLNGAEITIPEGCVLDFQGGSFKNGNVKGNNTILISNNTVIFDNINIIGTWDCYHITDKMFLYKEGNAENNTQILTNLFSLSSDNINNNITISRKYKCIPIYNSGLLVKSNTTVSGGGEIYAEPCSYNYAQLFRVNNAKNVIIENLKLVGDVQSHLGSTGEWNYGIYLRGSKNCIIRNCDISEFWGDGINIQKSEYMTDASANEVNYEYHCHNILIENCVISKNRRNNISIEAAIGVVVNNCKITDAGTINGTAPMIGIDIEPIPNNNQIAKNISISNCSFDNNIGKDISVPAAMTYGYLIINNCDLNSCTIWGTSGGLDITIKDSKIKGEETDNIHTSKSLILENTFIAHNLIASSEDVYINNCDIPSLSITSSKGEISKSNFGQLSPQNSQNLLIENCNFSQFYVHRNISDITFKNCNIKGSAIIMFNSNVEVSNIIFDNCILEDIGDRNPFVGYTHISSNCLMKHCVLKIKYEEEIWIPFDNYVDCNISAPRIKTLRDYATFENCTIITDNPINLNDVDNFNNVGYIFKNTYIYTIGELLTKSKISKNTYIKVYGGNITRKEESNEKLLYFTKDSEINNSTIFSKYYTFINYVSPSHSEKDKYISLRLPKINRGSIDIIKYPSNRWQSEKLTENINISIYNNTYKASIKVNNNSLSVSDYKKITYPKLYTDDNYIYITFLCINGLNADAIIKADIYSDSIMDTSEIGFVRIDKSSELLSIPTNIENIIKDNTSSLKTIPITEDISIQYGYSTDTNKPIWWTGEKWVDATGADV